MLHKEVYAPTAQINMHVCNSYTYLYVGSYIPTELNIVLHPIMHTYVIMYEYMYFNLLKRCVFDNDSAWLPKKDFNELIRFYSAVDFY